jgi:hypothetical protein
MSAPRPRAPMPIQGGSRRDFLYRGAGETMSRPATILVVEDDSGAAESLQHVLEDEATQSSLHALGRKGSRWREESAVTWCSRT